MTLFERKGIKFTLNWIPFGGFVRMAGEEAGFDVEGSLASKAPWRRILITAAGPGMNVVLALAIAISIPLIVGVPQAHGPIVVAQVFPGTPAWRTGVPAGVTLLQVDGVDPPTWCRCVGPVEAAPEQRRYAHGQLPTTLKVGACTNAPASRIVTLTPHLCPDAQGGPPYKGLPAGCLISAAPLIRDRHEAGADAHSVGHRVPGGTPARAVETYARSNLFSSIGPGRNATWGTLGLLLTGLGLLVSSVVSPAAQQVVSSSGGVSGPVRL